MASFRVEVKGLEEVARNMSAAERKQIPFALARSLTDTALDSQAKLRADLPSRFTLRRQKWEELGIRVKFARKTDLEARVEEWHDYMVLQEKGGTKTPISGNYIAIPLVGVQPNPRAIVRRRLRPRALLDSGKAFIIRARDGRIFILMKKGRGRKSKNVPAYLLKPKVTVAARFRFEETVRIIVDTKWKSHFTRRFDEAMKTAR